MRRPTFENVALRERMQRSVGMAIRLRRHALGLGQGTLASRLGTHRPVVARTERGQHDVTVGTLQRYAAALGCSGADLLQEAEALCTDGGSRTQQGPSDAQATADQATVGAMRPAPLLAAVMRGRSVSRCSA